MFPDTQPATPQNTPAFREACGRWVTARQVGVLMDNAMPVLVGMGGSLLVLVYLMAGEVNARVLSVWALMLLAMLLFQYRLMGIDRLRHDSTQGMQRAQFVLRYRWVWTALAFLWGASSFFWYRSTPFETQYVVSLVLLGQCVLAITALSPCRPVYRCYVHALMLGFLAGVVYGNLVHAAVPSLLMGGGAFVVLILLFWWLMMLAGRSMHRAHREAFELQFSKQVLIDDLTHQTQVAERAIQIKNRFLASAAHDLRQPVHALRLYADWLLAEPAMARDIAPRILQSTLAVNELFDSLFDLTRIDANQFKIQLQQLDLTELFEQLRLQFEPVAQSKGLKLRVHTGPVTVWADPVVMRRILSNLLSNALRHTQQGGILLGLRRRSASVVLEVWDTGVGIAQEHQQAIFQEFFRVPQHQGTENNLGLGLTIVSRLTNLLGYQVSLSSISGKGSVFRVQVPAHKPEQPVPADPRFDVAGLGGGRSGGDDPGH